MEYRILGLEIDTIQKLEFLGDTEQIRFRGIGVVERFFFTSVLFYTMYRPN